MFIKLGFLKLPAMDEVLLGFGLAVVDFSPTIRAYDQFALDVFVLLFSQFGFLNHVNRDRVY